MAGFDATILGTLGDDTMDLGALPATSRLWFRALDGNDTITSVNATNRIDAGNGNDHITSTGGTIYAGAGNDDINVTGSGTATIYDGAGSDHVFVSMAKGARATVYADTTDSTGDDWYINNNTGAKAALSYAANSIGSLVVDARTGLATGGSIGADHFSGFSEIFGGKSGTTIYANDSGMKIWTSGDTTAFGGSGDDSFIVGKASNRTNITDNSGGVIDIRAVAPFNPNNYTTFDAKVSTTSGGKIDLGGYHGTTPKVVLDDTITGVSNKITVIGGGGYFQMTGNDAYETVYVASEAHAAVNIGANGIVVLKAYDFPANGIVQIFASNAANSTNETMSYAASTKGIRVFGVTLNPDAPPGHFLINGDEVGGDSVGGFERIIGGSGNDLFVSDGGVYNAFFGGAGNDVFKSNVSNHFGRMDVKGGSGNDTCTGGKGFDVIELGDGTNTVTGGAGKDFFDFNTDIKAVAGQTHTTIIDFENGIDKIRLGGDLTKEFFLSHLTQDSLNTTFTSASGDTLTFNNIQVAQLDVTDFILM